MHEDNYYPWLSIWFEPSETIRHVMASGRLKIITIILFVAEGYVTTWMMPGLPTHSIFFGALLGVLLWPMTAFIALVYYLLGRLFRGQARYKEVFAVLVLSTIPNIAASIIVWIAGAPLLEKILDYGVGLWVGILIVAMYATVENFSKVRALVVMLLTALVVVMIATLIEHYMKTENSAKHAPNAEMYHKIIRQKVDANASAKTISELVVAGYDYVMDSDEAFRAYSVRYLDMFQTDTWQRNTMKTRDKMWLDAFAQSEMSDESLDPFFEQIIAFNNQGQEGNTTWNLIAKEIPDNYIEYLDKKLQVMLESNITVPMVTLYDETGNRIRDMNHSRQFFVSQIYNRIGDFYSDEQGVDSWALRYTKKGIKACPLNPNTLHMTSYYDNNATANVARYDRIMRLINGHEELYEYATTALYNNLGYQIYEANMTQRYDTALTLLQDAYDKDSDFTNSLATISCIYEYKKKQVKSYQVLEKEALNFLNSSDKALENQLTRYWVFVRRLISVSYDLHDYGMTQYVCEKYLKIKDADYEECQTDLDAIAKLSPEAKSHPIYSVWEKYDDQLDEAFMEAK